MLKAVSLFTGCGGSDAGVIAAGFDVVMANDKMAYAKDVYLANHPETDYVLSDVQRIKTFPDAQLLIGCYPCKGFSQGGARDPGRSVNALYQEFSRALGIIKPKAFVVENVSGMLRRDFNHLLEDQIKAFTETGYKVKVASLNASDFGVPQDRKRIFIVGTRQDLNVDYAFPAPTHGQGKPFEKVTIRDAIGNMPEWPVGEFYDEGFHWYYLSRNRRNDWDQTSKTIVANPRHMPLHPVSPSLVKVGPDAWAFANEERARRFSYREAARLQGFCENFIFPETSASSLRMRYTVVGNAVPPQLFEAVARSLPDIWD